MNDVFFIQQNFTVGDVNGNEQLLLTAATDAQAAGAAVALSPELSLTGYCPNDLMFHPSFQRAVEESVARLAAAAPPDLALLVGLPVWEDDKIYNAAALIRGGKVEGVHKKTVWAKGSTFDEARYFSPPPPDTQPLLFEARGVVYAVQICEEIWEVQRAERITWCSLREKRAEAILAPNASPFFIGKHLQRHTATRDFARVSGARVYYSHNMGGQDDLVFDGASFVADASGVIGQLPAFETYNGFARKEVKYPDPVTAMYSALICGLRDYARKSGFDRATGGSGVLLGLSGGVDSSLAATLAADALGADAVLGVMMPTEFTSEESLRLARALAINLGIEYKQIALNDALGVLRGMLSPEMIERKGDVTMENIQARLRGLLLMALSNNLRRMLLATSNKSESAYGYATLYGDTNGGFSPLADVLKTQVWELCRYRNAQSEREVIPSDIIERAPSAELRWAQVDQDSLPSYFLVDAMLNDHIDHLPRERMTQKYGAAIVEDFYRRLTGSEYKRRQIPFGVKISSCAFFGRDWRMPVANGYRYD